MCEGLHVLSPNAHDRAIWGIDPMHRSVLHLYLLLRQQRISRS